MNNPLRILHLEDMQSDAELVARELKKAGISTEIVLADHKSDFITALNSFTPDIILSDHSLPAFNSREALRIVQEMGMRIPFILVTATVSEEYAVNVIREGASDYILKDRLQRLPNAILSALDKLKLEKDREQALETLLASERKYKLMFESNPMPMWVVDATTELIITANDAAVNDYGYTRQEFLQMHWENLEVMKINGQRMPAKRSTDGIYKSGPWEHKKKDGSALMVDIIAHDITFEGKAAKLVLANDITDKLAAEEQLARERREQQKRITETGILVQERERDEIGKELHDNINQILAASKLYLEHSAKSEKAGPEFLQKGIENITLAIKEIRKLSHTLIVPSMGSFSLNSAIEELMRSIRLTTTLQLEFKIGKTSEQAIDPDMKLMFYRITQEQMQNILKHAKAKRVTIKFEATAEHYRLTIKDDGIGFDTVQHPEGIGLKNIKNRAQLYDGVTRVISSPGRGCKLEVLIPVKH